MKDWRNKMKERKVQDASPLKAVHIGLPHDTSEFARLIELFRDAAKADGKGRYDDESETENLNLPALADEPEEGSTREAYRHIQPAYPVPDEERRQVLDAREEPVPEEDKEADKRYSERLSEQAP